MQRAEKKLWKWLVGQTRSVEASRRQKKGDLTALRIAKYMTFSSHNCCSIRWIFLHAHHVPNSSASEMTNQTCMQHFAMFQRQQKQRIYDSESKDAWPCKQSERQSREEGLPRDFYACAKYEDTLNSCCRVAEVAEAGRCGPVRPRARAAAAVGPPLCLRLLQEHHSWGVQRGVHIHLRLESGVLLSAGVSTRN